jgi:sulfur relay (sulfurtransferase) DsrC/TusE family protein
MSDFKFIRDEEIKNLNGNDDLLETKKYANTLKEVITNSKTPFTIGLFGEWGSGKSSIVNTAQNDLEKDTNEKIKFIKYDAWKYANDSFRRMFLKTVQNELNIEGTSDFEAFYVDKNTTTKIDKKVNTSFIVMSLLIILIGFGSIFLISDDTSIEWKITVPLLIVVIGMSVSIARNFFDAYKVTVQNPKIFAPEQFEDIFDEMIDSALTTKTITKPQKWIQGEFKENKIDKIVIIIDNIDRCDKETAYELLTNIKNFLERDGIIFVVPIDDSALRRHLKDKNNEDKKEADEFLRKFFNVTLKIKHFQSRDLFIFTNELNKKNEMNLSPDTIDIIAKEYATNPRRVIQLLNNLISELNIVEQKYDSDFIEKYESLIAKLLIIREEWSCVFKQISNKPHILNKDSEILFDTNSKIKNDVVHFLTRTKAISENIDVQIIEQLTSNIDNDLKISNEILDYILNNEYEKVKDYIEDNNNYNELLYYFIEEFKKELERETFKVGALNRFKDIINLNELKEIPHNINNKLYSETSEENILKIIENLSEDDFNAFFIFVNVNQNQNLKYLENLIIKQFKLNWKDMINDDGTNVTGETIWNEGLSNFINNSDNLELLKEIQDYIVNYYAYYSNSPNEPNLLIYKEQWINKDKLKYIVGNKLINYLINKAEPTLDDDNYQELLYFSKLGIISIGQIQSIFDKLVTEDSMVFENPLEEAKKEFLINIITIVKKLNELVINVTKTHKLKSNSIKNYLEFINKTHSISHYHPSYPQGQHRQNANIKLVDIIVDESSYYEELLKLYFEVYRMTANYTSVTLYMKDLVTKHEVLEEVFFKYLINLRDNNKYHLKQLFDYLLEFNSIDSDLFNLYEQLFIQDEYKNSDSVKDKLNSLIGKYLSEENETIESFLTIMLQYDSIKELITNIVTALSTDEIVLLPKEIQQLTYDYLCENDKLFDIEDKIDFIKEVLIFDKKYKDCVVKIIVAKLQNKVKVKGALDILEQLKHPSSDNKSELYTALKKQEKHIKLADEVVKYIKKYST